MPALLSASNAMPALIAPSPITATTRRSSPLRCAAIAMPSAAEIDVDECAVPNVSYSLSLRRGKPEGPPHAAAWPSLRGGRSGSCARTSGGRRPRRGGRAACRTRSAARPSARPCRGSTTGGRRSCATECSRNARSSRASCGKRAPRQLAQVGRLVDRFEQRILQSIDHLGLPPDVRCAGACPRKSVIISPSGDRSTGIATTRRGERPPSQPRCGQ